MKPEPINQHIVCSVCGLNWGEHGLDPTLETCVRLLKEELVVARKRSQILYYGSGVSVT